MSAERLSAVEDLRDRAYSEDSDVAVAARAGLVALMTDDDPEVAAAADAALAETSISLVPGRIDFGPVAPGTPRLAAVIKIEGSPMALASRIKVTGPGLRARIAGDQLQVQWQPGDGALAGMVSLDGPAGAADLPVTGHIGAGLIGGEALETWPPEPQADAVRERFVSASGSEPLADAVRGNGPRETGEPLTAAMLESWPFEMGRARVTGLSETETFEPISAGLAAPPQVTFENREPVFLPPTDPPEQSRRRVKGLIIAGATALVLLVGTGLAAAVTLQDDQAPVAQQQEQPAGNEQPSGGKNEQPGGGKNEESGGDKSGEDEQQGGGQEQVRASVDKPAVVGTIKVGDEPEGVAVAPDSKTLYVANQSSRILSVADLESGQVDEVALRNTPRFVAVSRDGKRVFVSMYEDDLSGSGVAVVDAEKLTVLRNLKTGVQPYALAVAPDGRLWVPIHGGRNVEIYKDEQLTGRVFVPENPHAVSFDKGGQRAFTPDHESSTVSAIDTRNDKRLKSIPVSAAPHSLAVSPDGRTAVVACFQADAVDLIDTQTLERRGPFKVGDKPQAAAFATDSGHAYAVNEGSNSVSVVDPRTGQVTATVPVGKSPRTMAVAPDGRLAYVTNGDDDTVSVLRVS
ncbi:beta-propeller fold lactonase family protein [Paractinoplanes lichenicola]|uniref:Beta-propeller fold lactonase family protein n=1 Tax=Paractinoplanes lichenicola TaxID=2802976 RepID=A0ABS1VSU7_9ACTN|nr:beta-propeller fold lactonase family protein [Actinoplanes lichenicola]MBL7257538.1 beta-propeller fold lactonase family protein [Actinoplanes lichenicola]